MNEVKKQLKQMKRWRHYTQGFQMTQISDHNLLKDISETELLILICFQICKNILISTKLISKPKDIFAIWNPS